MKRSRGLALRLWDGVRMRRCTAAADADGDLRPVTLPAAWDDSAAAGLAALAPGSGPASLPALAGIWLSRLEQAGGAALASAAHALLLRQEAAPAPALWQGRGGAFRLNLSAAHGDPPRLFAAAEVAAAALRVLSPGARPVLQVTGLADLLAAEGLDYGSEAARALARGLLSDMQARLPGASLRAAEPDAADALLGVETSGIAPAFGPLGNDGALSRAALAFLAARGIGPAAALAACLSGHDMLAAASPADHAAMDAALAPLLDARPGLPAALPVRPRAAPRREELPRRRGGLAHKAVVGGQKVFLRTGEFADGRPGEVAISLPQASPAVRALLECLSHAIGIGLQHGAPLAEFADALAGTRFAPAGLVEGDPAVPRATSAIDYAMRHLAHAYLPGLALPPTEADGDDAPPLLPLELPQETAHHAPARRRGLRVVK